MRKKRDRSPGGLTDSAAVLPVDNLAATLEFYEEKLGFKAVYTYGDPPHYAILMRDEVSIHMAEREDTTTEIQPCSVYIYVTDVDAIYKEYKSKKLEMFLPPEDQGYGMREFEVPDINGHFLTFGQRISRAGGPS